MNILKPHFIRNAANLTIGQWCRPVSYVQGQSPKPGLREYFYYIDHQGMLFLDDTKIKNFTSCFKDKEFLLFFYKQLRANKTARYLEEFPFVSRCGVEMNYIRCDDTPIVFTHIDTATDKKGVVQERIYYNHAGDRLYELFQPTNLTMFPRSGRVYHPASRDYGGVGLVKSSLSIELSKQFSFDNGEHKPPTHFNWKGTKYELTNSLWRLIEMRDKRPD